MTTVIRDDEDREPGEVVGLRSRSIRAVVMLAVMSMVIGLGPAAWGQDYGRSAEWFRVSWAPRSYGIEPAIEGWVHNDSLHRVSNVRLRIEGLGADSRPVGEVFVWAFGDIGPNDRASFVARAVRGAATYRISVASFDMVSRGGP
jgi:hypothetical protein